MELPFLLPASIRRDGYLALFYERSFFYAKPIRFLNLSYTGVRMTLTSIIQLLVVATRKSRIDGRLEFGVADASCPCLEC